MGHSDETLETVVLGARQTQLHQKPAISASSVFPEGWSSILSNATMQESEWFQTSINRDDGSLIKGQWLSRPEHKIVCQIGGVHPLTHQLI